MNRCAPTRPCAQCGADFTPHHEQEKICSDACRRARTAARKLAAYRPAPPPEPRECAQCGKTFTPERNHAVVCSDACRAVRTRQRAARKAATKTATRAAPKTRRRAKAGAAAQRRMAEHFDREITIDPAESAKPPRASDARARGRVRRRIEDLLERRAERAEDPLYQPAPTLHELAERFAGGGA